MDNKNEKKILGKKKKKEQEKEEEEEEEGEEESSKEKDSKKKKKSEMIVNDDEVFLHLDNKKRLTVRKFKGKLLIDIREFYEDDGEMKPGKKGISLSKDCWKKICENLSDINEAIDNMN